MAAINEMQVVAKSSNISYQDSEETLNAVANDIWQQIVAMNEILDSLYDHPTEARSDGIPFGLSNILTGSRAEAHGLRNRIEALKSRIGTL